MRFEQALAELETLTANMSQYHPERKKDWKRHSSTIAETGPFRLGYAGVVLVLFWSGRFPD